MISSVLPSVLAEIILLGLGFYAILLGFGRLSWPAKLRNSEEIALVGRIMLFLAGLVLPTCFGFSFSDVREWLESIWTSGGGAGTG